MIETAFNSEHKMTDKEWQYICGMNRDIYLKVVDEESAKFDLASLYYYRGDRKKVMQYLEGLKPNYVNDFWRTVTHP